MEKYNKWRDAFSGVHPFLPPPTPRRGFLMRVGLWALRAKFISWRLPLLGIGLVALFIRSLLLVLLGTVAPAAAAPVRRFFDTVLCRLLLLNLGFWRIEGAGPSFSLRPNEIIISTLTSYVDVLFVAYRFSPATYVLPSSDGKLRQLGLASCVLETLLRPSHLRAASAGDGAMVSLSALRAHGRGPVVVFPEGVTSNGAGVLTFALPVAAWDVDRVLLSTARHHGVLTVGSPLAHLMDMITRPGGRIRSRCELLAIPQEARNRAEAVREAVARLSGVPAVGIGAAEKAEFAHAFHRA